MTRTSGSEQVSGLSGAEPRADDAASCVLTVEGMDCSSCAESVDKALRSLAGVHDVRTDVVGQRVTVTYAEGKLARGDLTGALSRIGYRTTGDAPVREEIFEVEGMCCATEARQIESKLGDLPGVARLRLDPVNRKLTVEGEIAAAEVERAVAQLGMKARLIGEARVKESWWGRRQRLLLAAVAGVLWASSLAAEHWLDVGTAAAILATGAIITGGWYIVPRGLRAARHRALDMNFLMSVAAFGALIIGEYGEAASAMFLFAVAQLLETYSMDRARNAIRSLMDLSPATAAVVRGGQETRVPADQVQIGEMVIVRPGEKIPVDGDVLSGRSSVNQAPITGESVPADKEPGEEVFAGTLNGEGVLEIRSSRAAEDTTLARIIHSVEEAQASRAPSQTFVDRFARIYTPAVVLSAIALAVLPPLIGFGGWSEWFYRSLVLLVVACPCALVISTPVTIVSALAGAARRGILIKGGLHLENAGRARTIALDKTGTLTEGQPAVAEIVALDGTTPQEVLALAAAVEARSEHPLARAVLRHAQEGGIRFQPASEVAAVPGRGIRAQVGGTTAYLGSARWFAELGAPAEAARQPLHAFATAGQTAVLVGTAATNGGRDAPPRILGAIAIADRVRPGAAEALVELRRAGIDRIVVLTGDSAATAHAVAESLRRAGAQIDQVHADLLPDDKVAAIQELRRTARSVAFVGDGVNDAPALATADVGIAMGSAGSGVALETADIALMADDLSKIPVTIRLARKAEGIIRANIAFALATKAIFVALAAAGQATLWMAVFADMGASLLVVLNGIRALRE